LRAGIFGRYRMAKRAVRKKITAVALKVARRLNRMAIPLPISGA
jgi:hypothetical protein